MNPENLPSPGRSMFWRALLAGVAIMLMTAAAVSAAAFMQLDDVQEAFDEANGRTTIELPSIDPAEAGEPRTIMILGTDARLGNDPLAGEPRSDTIILARLDARKDAITLMSIPRDLKVEIPGFQYRDKINAAYAAGKAKLTLRTVQNLLSRPGKKFQINHVVEVSFTGFRRMVDYLGCAYVDIDRDYFNDVSGPGGFATIDINPGYQKLCGSDALDYVRYRHLDNDLVRGARQQDFIRQLLRQPGVRKRLSFSNRKQLARIAGKYTRTDKSLRETKQLISLLKLGLAVADKPIQEVPFGAGRIQEDGPYLTVSRRALDDTIDDFLNAKPVPEATAGDERDDPEAEPREKRKRKKPPSKIPSGLELAQSEGENQAIAAARKVDFPFYFPRLRVTGARYPYNAPRTYKIKDELGRKHDAYRMVASVGVVGEYYGIQGMTWMKPPILDGPHDVRTVNGRKLRVYYDGKRVRLVAWRKGPAVYYVHNTLARTVSSTRLIAIAASLRRLGR